MWYLGGGKIETVIWTATKRLIRITNYYGNHTEVTRLAWIK